MTELKAISMWNEGDWIVAIGSAVLLAFLLVGAWAVTRPQPEVGGHPKGLYILFFAEMWERFSYYGMRALLIFFLTQHWLYNDSASNIIYGAYVSLVYITPVLGGWLADRYLGQRKAVLFGALLLTFGHFCMAFEGDPYNGVEERVEAEFAEVEAGSPDSAYETALAMAFVDKGAVNTDNLPTLMEDVESRSVQFEDGITIDPSNIIATAEEQLREATEEDDEIQMSSNLIDGEEFDVMVDRLSTGQQLQNPMAINIFWLALAFIIVGSGFLKANISVIVGQLYSRTDVRRDGAYTIFYMGINVGAAIGVIIAGYLGQTVGWAYGFGAAGIGMLLGLIVFMLGKPLLLGRGEPPRPLAKSTEMAMYGIGIVGVGVMWLLIQYQGVVGGLMLVCGVGLLGYVLYEAFKLDKEPRERIFAILFLIALQPLFWGLFEQAGGSLNLFTDRYIDRQGVPASLFQSINPIYIILLAPVFASLWTWLGRRGLEPSTPAKFGLGLVQLGFGFLVLVWGAAMVGVDARIPVIFLFGIYLFHTTGELCLSPVGLSAMNRLSPTHMASLIMGAWFFATAGGNYVAGMIGAATGGEEGEMTREATLSIYQTIGWVAIAVGIVVILISGFVKKLMHLDTLKDDTVDDDMLGQSELAEPQAAGIDTSGEVRN